VHTPSLVDPSAELIAGISDQRAEEASELAKLNLRIRGLKVGLNLPLGGESPRVSSSIEARHILLSTCLRATWLLSAGLADSPELPSPLCGLLQNFRRDLLRQGRDLLCDGSDLTDF
jgi:hypothetical protein